MLKNTRPTAWPKHSSPSQEDMRFATPETGPRNVNGKAAVMSKSGGTMDSVHRGGWWGLQSGDSARIGIEQPLRNEITIAATSAPLFPRLFTFTNRVSTAMRGSEINRRAAPPSGCALAFATAKPRGDRSTCTTTLVRRTDCARAARCGGPRTLPAPAAQSASSSRPCRATRCWNVPGTSRSSAPPAWPHRAVYAHA